MPKDHHFLELQLRLTALAQGSDIGRIFDSNLRDPKFQLWWDSLSSDKRAALETAIDTYSKYLEDWKLQDEGIKPCPLLPSQTLPTPLFADPQFVTSVQSLGQTGFRVEYQVPHSGKFDSPLNPLQTYKVSQTLKSP